MIIFFDFDDVLFNRNKFISALAGELGLSLDEFLRDYNNYFKKKKKNYSLREHLKILGKFYQREKWDLFFKDLSKFVYPGTREALSALQRGKTGKMILLSRGDKDFQEKKIQGSGLRGFFEEVIIASDKISFLSSRNFKEEVIFINDKQEENKKIKKYFPEFKIAESLDDFKKLIKKI